jgi:hypothetical protein
MSTRWSAVTVLVGVGAFGVLMALRSEVSGTAARAALAALAFACLGVMLAMMGAKARRT